MKDHHLLGIIHCFLSEWNSSLQFTVLLHHCELEKAGQGVAEQEKEIHSDIQHTVKNSENIPKSYKKKRLVTFGRGAVRPAADMAVASVEGRPTMERCPQSTKRK